MRGFTLMELMITVAVVGILASIAYPTYTAYVLKGNRSVAKARLMEVASKQESFLADRKTYATKMSDLGFPADIFFVSKNSNLETVSTSNSLYRITMLFSAANTFTLIATPVQGQVRDHQCASLLLTSLGDRSVSGPAGADECW
ncbi:MAG TPA: type IV pilin protein [Solimonas sp.]|nr:type IV pilin protein [Solimonas sp.]